jgi:hypothetical protein
VIDCSKKLALSLAAAVVCITAAGCGGVYDSTVSGVVTLENTIVPRGTVTFSPQGAIPASHGPRRRPPAGSVHRDRRCQRAARVLSQRRWRARRLGKTDHAVVVQRPANSGLSFAVADGDNVIDLNLTSKPPAGWKPPPGRR